MSFLQNKVFLDFKSYLEEAGVIGTALGFLTASATLDLSRTIVNELLLPNIIALRTRSIPVYDLDEVLQSVLTFFLSFFVAFAVIKIGGFQQKKLPMVVTVAGGGLA